MNCKSKIFVLAVAVAVSGFAGVGNGDEVSELKAQMKALQERIEALEKEQKAENKRLTKEITEVSSRKSPEIPEGLKWAEDVEISGDFRYRNETTDQDGKDDRTRNRIRARLKIEGKVNDDLDYSMRLATGSDDPASTNETFDDGFSSKDIWLDRAFLDYHGFENINILAGKMGNPFVTVGGNQLIWDSDVNPEGAALKMAFDIDKTSSVFANLGGMWVEEDSSDVDQGMFGGQLGITGSTDDQGFTAGIGYFDYGNLEQKLTVYDPKDNYGNTAVVNGDGETIYVYDYNLLEAFVSYDFKAGNLPVSVYGDYVKNIASDVKADTGWLAGFKVGKLKLPGDWNLGYNYRDLEADATVGAFTDSDFIGGGTNGKGHKFSAGYAIAKNFTTNLTYLKNEKGDEKDDYDRLQLDFKLKF